MARTPLPIDYIEPTPEERDAGLWIRCGGCQLDWPLRCVRLGTRRCVACARERERERKARSRARRAGREPPGRTAAAAAIVLDADRFEVDIEALRREYSIEASPESAAAVDEHLAALLDAPLPVGAVALLAANIEK